MQDATAWTQTRRRLLASTILLAAASVTPPAHAEPGDKIRPIVLLTKPQSVDPSLFQAAQLAVQQWAQARPEHHRTGGQQLAAAIPGLERSPEMGRNHLGDGRKARTQRSR